MKLTKSEVRHLQWLAEGEADAAQIVVAGLKVYMMERLYKKGLVGYRPYSNPYPRYIMVKAGREALKEALKQNQRRKDRRAGKIVKAVYITQFLGWWKLTPEAWRDLCAKSVAAYDNDTNYQWDLSQAGRTLMGVPYHAVCVDSYTDRDGNKRSSYYSRTNAALVYRMPVDWEEDEWREALKTIEEALS